MLSGYKNSHSGILSLPAFVFLLIIASCSLFTGRVSVEKFESPEFPRMDLGAVTVGSEIYAIGGFAEVTVPYVEAYNTGTEKWTRKTDMPTARRCFAIAEIDGLIYVTGGMDFTDPNSVTYIFSTEIYDPFTDSWGPGADFPMALPVNSVYGNAFISGAPSEGKFYVFVFNTEEPGGTATYEYNPAGDIWNVKMPPPYFSEWEYEELSTSSKGGNIYLYYKGEMAVYNTAGDFWSSPNTYLAWDERYFGGIENIGECIYAFYGCDYYGDPVYGVEVFDIAERQWTRQGWTKSYRAFFSSVSYDDSIYVIGGTLYGDRYSPELAGYSERIFMKE